MVAQSKFSQALGLVIGFCNVLNVQGHWMGPMPLGGELNKRTTGLTCESGYVPCGDAGCLPQERCCNKDAGWNCPAAAACYTVSGVVDCYMTSINPPTTTRGCFDYTATGCPDNSGCFKCVSTAYPSCYTQKIQTESLVWLDCYATGGVYIVTPTPTETSVKATAASATGDSVGNLITAAPTGKAASEITSTASTSDTSSSSGLSTGALAGIGIGAFALVAIIGVLVFLLMKKSRNNNNNNNNMQQHHGNNMESMPFQSPPTPYAQNPPHYPPSMATVPSPVSYQEHYALDQAMKSQYTPTPPPQPPVVLAELGDR